LFQLIGSNALRRKEIPQINFQEGTPVNCIAGDLLMKLVERIPRLQSCQGKGWLF
jgi:hypothetical protein